MSEEGRTASVDKDKEKDGQQDELLSEHQGGEKDKPEEVAGDAAASSLAVEAESGSDGSRDDGHHEDGGSKVDDEPPKTPSKRMVRLLRRNLREAAPWFSGPC